MTLAERAGGAAATGGVGVVGNFRLTEDLGFAQGFDVWFPSRWSVVKPRARHITQDAIRFYDRHVRAVPVEPLDPPPAASLPALHGAARALRPAAAARGGGASGRRRRERARRSCEREADGRRALGRAVARRRGLLRVALRRRGRRRSMRSWRGCSGGLRRRGLLDHAIVVVTADHGEEFREHGALQHGTTLFEESVRVPLIMIGPGLPAGRVVADEVSLVDVAPTMLELRRRCRPSRASRVARCWTCSARRPIAATSCSSSCRSVCRSTSGATPPAWCTMGWLLLPCGRARSPALYDLRDDPHEPQPDPPAISAQERPRCAPASGSAAPPLATRAGKAESAPVDDEMRERLRALGYAH